MATGRKSVDPVNATEAVLRELLLEAAKEIETFLAHDIVDCQEPSCEMCAEDRRVADLARRLREAAEK